MDKFYISSEVLGTERHMEVSSEGFSTVSRVPPDSWLLGVSPRNSGNPCLNSLFRLGGSELRVLPPEPDVTAMSIVAPDGPRPWAQVMPPTRYKTFVKNLIKSIVGNMDAMPKEYCRVTWMACGSLLDRLRPAKIDTVAFKAASEAGNPSLESFRPGGGGYAQPVVYDRFATRTGRLTVASGPNILTLKKDHRRLLRSHFPDGCVVSLDFSALEARLVLLEAGVVPSSGDIYSQISNELFSGRIPRDAVKVAVLSELYGASRSSLAHKLDMPSAEVDKFVDAMRGYFRTPELRRRLADEVRSSGKILNKFGRPLMMEDASSDHLFVNTFAQSTGVDVSLLGFKQVVDDLGPEGIRPLFVLHDALILDVRGDRLADVEAVKSTSVPGYSSKFPLKFETV